MAFSIPVYTFSVRSLRLSSSICHARACTSYNFHLLRLIFMPSIQFNLQSNGKTEFRLFSCVCFEAQYTKIMSTNAYRATFRRLRIENVSWIWQFNGMLLKAERNRCMCWITLSDILQYLFTVASILYHLLFPSSPPFPSFFSSYSLYSYSLMSIFIPFHTLLFLV